MAMIGFVMVWQRPVTKAGVARWHLTFERAVDDARSLWQDANPAFEQVIVIDLVTHDIVWDTAKGQR